MTKTSTGAMPFRAPTNRLPKMLIQPASGTKSASTVPSARPMRIRTIRLVSLYFLAKLRINCMKKLLPNSYGEICCRKPFHCTIKPGNVQKNFPPGQKQGGNILGVGGEPSVISSNTATYTPGLPVRRAGKRPADRQSPPRKTGFSGILGRRRKRYPDGPL